MVKRVVHDFIKLGSFDQLISSLVFQTSLTEVAEVSEQLLTMFVIDPGSHDVLLSCYLLQLYDCFGIQAAEPKRTKQTHFIYAWEV